VDATRAEWRHLSHSSFLKPSQRIGGATHAAALKIRAKALDMAGELLQAAPKELDIADAVVRHRDRPEGPSIALRDIARHLEPDSPVLGGRDPGLTAEAWFRADHMTYAYGVLSASCASIRRPGTSRWSGS
jgi:carbon-monoxide dehydrogenase large subunit